MKQLHAPLPQEVMAALAKGNKIEAIRLLREATGLSLAAAKEAVERGGTPPIQDSVVGSQALPAQVLAELARGNKIQAIKLLRKAKGLGLKEAKDAIDAAEPSRRNATTRLAPGEVPRSSGAAWGLCLLLVEVLAGVLAYLKLR